MNKNSSVSFVKRVISAALITASLAAICLGFTSCAPKKIIETTKEYLTQNWKLSRVPDTSAKGEALSKSGYAYTSDKQWLNATVPGTALTTFQNNKLVADDLYYGTTLQDMDSDYYNVDYWYTCEFDIPENAPGERTWLNFDGINWKADLYLNGKSIGNINGAYTRGKFDITDTAVRGQKNYLAVYIHWCNSSVIDMPSFLVAEGWDFSPPIPGRNVGIYKDVYLTYTGDVAVRDPHISTDLDLPNTDKAILSVTADIVNSTDKKVSGKLNGLVYPKGGDPKDGISFSTGAKVEAGETATISFKDVTLNNPQLWWPNGYGDQNLYCLQVTFVEGFGNESDTATTTFGVREFTYMNTDKDSKQDLILYCNGRKIMCRGGNWGVPDALYQYTYEDFDRSVALEAEQNFNIIRCWHGTSDFDAFYDACDKYGIIVFDDFWLNGWDSPRDVKMFVANVEDKVRRLRNRACLAVWIGENEATPPGALSLKIPRTINELDGVRYYEPASNSNSLSGGISYSINEPSWYFEQSSTHEGFTTELGCVSIPNVESMRLMMSEDDLWPIGGAAWDFHDYDGDIGNKLPEKYTDSVNRRYGSSSSIDEFCQKAQLMNYETFKAIYESWNDKLFNNCSGLLLWMSHQGWPSTIWQTYDYFFEQNGAYFGSKWACEPAHVQMNASTGEVKVINTTADPLTDVTVTAEVYNSDSSLAYTESAKLTAQSDTAMNAMNLFTGSASLNTNSAVTKLHFVKLYLKDPSGNVISSNFYWRSKSGCQYSDLNTMANAELSIGTAKSSESGKTKVTLTLNNSSSAIAVAIRVKAIRDNAAAGEDSRILPMTYTDNYFSLLPGESKTIELEYEDQYLYGGNCQIVVEGYNTAAYQFAA